MKLGNGQSLRFSNRELLAMLFPVIINDLTSLVVNIVDSVMVSSTGEAAVSAVSLVGTLYSIFTMLLATLGIGCSVVVAQHIGAGHLDHARTTAKQSVYIGLCISIPMFILLMIFGPALLKLVYPDTDPAVMNNARIYFLLIIPTIPFIGAEQMFVGTLRAMGKTKPILILGLARNVLNIIGNTLLIYVFKLGVAGAAIATTASCIVCTFISFALVRSKKLPFRIQGLRHPEWDIREVKRVLSIGLGTGLERCLLMVGKVMVTSMYSGLSAAAIAAFSVSRTLCNFGWTIQISFGTILMTVVGQCIGAGQPEQAKMYTKKFLYFALPLNVLMYGAVFLLRHKFVMLYNFSEETLLLAAQYTGLGALLTILGLYPLAILPAYSFRAAGDTRYAVISSTVITFACQVGLCFIFVKYLNWGIPGVWLSIGIDWVFRVICHGIHLHRGKWLTKKVI